MLFDNVLPLADELFHDTELILLTHGNLMMDAVATQHRLHLVLVVVDSDGGEVVFVDHGVKFQKGEVESLVVVWVFVGNVGNRFSFFELNSVTFL